MYPKQSQAVNDYMYISIKEFAKRTGISVSKARELSQSKAYKDHKIAIRLNKDSKAGVRINWNRFVHYSENYCPVVQEYVKPKRNFRKEKPTVPAMG